MNSYFCSFKEAAQYAKVIARAFSIVSCVTRNGSCWVVTYDVSHIAGDNVITRRSDASEDELHEDGIYDDVEAEIEEELEDAIENYTRSVDEGWFYPDRGTGWEDNIVDRHW